MERVDVGKIEELVAKGVLLITGRRGASCSHRALYACIDFILVRSHDRLLCYFSRLLSSVDKRSLGSCLLSHFAFLQIIPHIHFR
jgi:hypothetical protein